MGDVCWIDETVRHGLAQYGSLIMSARIGGGAVMDDAPEIEDEMVVIAQKRRDAGKDFDGHGSHDGPPGPPFGAGNG